MPVQMLMVGEPAAQHRGRAEVRITGGRMPHAGAEALGTARLPESPETVAVNGAAVGAQHHVGRTPAVGVDVVEGRLSEAGGRLAHGHDHPGARVNRCSV